MDHLLGTTVLSGHRLDSLVAVDNAVATFRALAPDGSIGTLRISLLIEVSDAQLESLPTELTRLARHAVGIQALLAPRAAGRVIVDNVPRLAMVHAGDPCPNLESRLQEGKPASIDSVLGLLEPIARALQALHDQGMVHGAVQPSALRFDVLGSDLSAFGWSDLAMGLQGPPGACHALSVSRRPPELSLPHPTAPTPETDTYALAWIVLELLLGKRVGSQDQTVLPEAKGHGLAPSIEAVLSEALHPQAQQRRLDPQTLLRKLSEARFEANRPAPAPADDPIPAPFTQPSKPEPAEVAPTPELSLFGQRRVTSTQEQTRVTAPTPAPLFRFDAPAPKRADAWFVYALVGLGALLLAGGVGSVFYYMSNASPKVAESTTSPSSSPPVLTVPTAAPTPPPPSSPPVLTAPTAAPTPPLVLPDAPQPLAQDSQEDASVPKLPAGPPSSEALAVYPEDASALVPVLADTVVFGTRDAPVTVVLFVDMRCPHSGSAQKAMSQLLAEYPSDVRLSIRHLPVDGAASETAAQIAVGSWALSGRKVFWDVFGTLTRHGDEREQDELLQWAEQAGADKQSLADTLRKGTYRSVVERDVNLAGQLMVRATPTFFINGIRLNGMPPQVKLQKVVQAERFAMMRSTPGGSSRYASRVLFNITAATDD